MNTVSCDHDHEIMMAASLCWLLHFVALFPAVLGQKLDIDVAIGETAKLPLRYYTDFDDSKALGLIQVNDTTNPYTYEELLTLAAGAPVQNAIIHGKWQGRLSLLDGPDGTVAELRNVRPSDTGRKVYCQYQQAGHQGPKMYINLRTPPPSVSSFSITDVGEDYANITFQQVEPLDSTPVEYYVEYREAGVSSSDSWQQTGRVPHNTSITNQLIKVEGLRTGVRYQFRVVSSNRFGESYSHIEEAGTKVPQKSNGSGLDSGVIAGIVVPIIAVLVILGAIYYKYRQRIRERCCNRSPRDVESDGKGKQAARYKPVPNKDSNNPVPSDVEIDASKEDSEAEITGEVTGPPANVNNVESAAMNNLSQTGQEENKTVGSQDTCNSSVHDALLLYEENDRDDDREEIRKIIQMLQSWGVSLCDPYNRGQYDQMEVFAQSLEESRHAVVFLTQKVLENIKENRKDQTTFRMSTFLCKMLNEHVQIGSQQLVPVKLADGETPSILMAFNMLNPKTKGFERKLFKSFTKPGGLPDHLIQQKVKDMKRMCQLWKEEDRTKLVKQLASDKYLDIPLDVVSNILQEFGGFSAKLEEVLRCWRSRNGEEATEAAIDAAIQELKAQQNDSSIGSDQTTKAEADAVTRVVKEEDFQEIQEHIGSKWKNVARRLGLSEGQIDCIMHDYEEQTLDEKVYQMLLKWKKLKGESATVAVLTQALQQEGLPNVADKIEN